jgi:hypothetical protein
MRRVKIHQIILLIIRTLILILIILAFARPALKGHFSYGENSHSKTSVVILLDNSFSMGILDENSEGKRPFDRAKKIAKQVVDLLNEGDEAFLIALSNPSEIITPNPTYNFFNLKILIDKLELSYKSTDLLRGIILADKLLSNSKNLNKEIYIVTDFETNGFNIKDTRFSIRSKSERTQDEKSMTENSKADIYLFPLLDEPEGNVAIEKINFANQIFYLGEPIEIKTKVKNFGKNSVNELIVSLHLGDNENIRRVGQSVVSLKSEESKEISFKVIPEKSGYISGYAEIEDDPLLEDNRRYFSFYIPEKINVMLAGKNQEDIKFISLVLEQISNRFRAEYVAYEKIVQTDFEKYNVLFFLNIPQFSQSEILRIKNHLSQGKGIMIFLGDNVDIVNYNNGILKELGFSKILRIDKSNAPEISSFLTFGKMDFKHPVFLTVFEKNKETVDSPKFYYGIKNEMSSKSRTIISFSNNSPFLEEVRFYINNLKGTPVSQTESLKGYGKALLTLTSLSMDWTDLTVKGIFPPLIIRSATYLATNVDEFNNDIIVGETFSMSVSTRKGENFVLKTPDGEVKLKPKFSKNSSLITFDETKSPGIHNLYQDQQLLKAFHVNIDSRESNLEVQNFSEFQKAFPNAKIVKNQTNLSSEILQSRYGMELWKYIVGLVIILLILEMIISKMPGQIT